MYIKYQEILKYIPSNAQRIRNYTRIGLLLRRSNVRLKIRSAIFRSRASKIVIVEKKERKKEGILTDLSGPISSALHCNLELQLQRETTCCKQVHEIISRFNNETWD